MWYMVNRVLGLPILGPRCSAVNVIQSHSKNGRFQGRCIVIICGGKHMFENGPQKNHWYDGSDMLIQNSADQYRSIDDWVQDLVEHVFDYLLTWPTL